MMRDRVVRKYLVLLFVLMAIFLVAFYTCIQTLLRGTEQKPIAEKEPKQIAEKEQTEAESRKPDSPSAVLFFASDYQQAPEWTAPEETLGNVLDASIGDKKEITGIVLCGDYSNYPGQSNYQISPEESIGSIRDCIRKRLPALNDNQILFSQGNHDALTESIATTGLHEYHDYLVYVVNTQNDFPWDQGRTKGALKKVRAAAREMKKCFDRLIEKGENRPIIIAGHVPLHFTAWTSTRYHCGDNLYASLLFDVVNDAGRKLDIIYLFGHNHTKGWDCYVGGSCVYKAVGDTLLIPQFRDTDTASDKYSEETLTFTYLNAGYLGYYQNCGKREVDNGTADRYHAAEEALTGTVCEIWTDRMVISRYSADGMHCLGGKGEANPYDGFADRNLIKPSSYSKKVDSPQSIVRKP